MQLSYLKSNPYVGKFSVVLLTELLVSAYILPQYQNITNFFASTGSMDPLSAKHHHMINPQKQYIYILRDSFEVYNVLLHNGAGKFHTKLHTSNQNDYINITLLHEKILRVHKYPSYSYV